MIRKSVARFSEKIMPNQSCFALKTSANTGRYSKFADAVQRRGNLCSA
jgi:hypothetical protein